MVSRDENGRAFSFCDRICLARLENADRFAMGPKQGLL